MLVRNELVTPVRLDDSEAAAETLDGLQRDIGDQVEVLIHVEDGESRQFGGCGDQPVGNLRCAVVTALGEQTVHFNRTSLYAGRQVLDGQIRNRWLVNLPPPILHADKGS